MPLNKKTVTVIIFLLFAASSIILWSNLFLIPPDAGSEYYMDKVFYFGSLIIFWITTPYLLSKLIRRIIWKSEFSNSISAGSIGRIEDLIVTAVYFFSIGVVIIKTTGASPSFMHVLLILILFAVTVFLRPKFLLMTKSGFIQSARPFKIGDWISLRGQNGNASFTGKIIKFDAKSVQLKSQENTLLIVPNSQMNNYVVENFNSLSKEIVLSIPYSIGSGVNINHAKRILSAAVKDALKDFASGALQNPEILITGISKDTVEYKINFYFPLWNPYSPDFIRDKIFSKIKLHLDFADIDSGNSDKKDNILNYIEIFSSLSENEMKEIYSSSAIKYYRPAETIIKQGEKGNSMYILKEGLLEVSLNEAGKESIKVGSISPGQFFGEMSLFTGEDRSATVIAEAESIAVEIKKDSLQKIIFKRPELADAFGDVIAERQSINLKKLDDYLSRKKSFAAKITANIKAFFNLQSGT